MALTVNDGDSDVLDRLERLARELRDLHRELERVRLERRMSPTIVLFLVVALGAALATGSVDAQTSGRVVAPFTVVDKNGRDIFKVVDQNGRATITAGHVVIGTGASGGGFLVVQRSNGNDALSLGELKGSFGFRVLDVTGNTELPTVGEAPKVGGGAVVAHDGSGKIRMLMSGHGELHVVDAAGLARVAITSVGALSIHNAKGATVARLADGGGAGQFQLANSGTAIVEAGLLDSGVGVVRALPAGPPGTLIMGTIKK